MCVWGGVSGAMEPQIPAARGSGPLRSAPPKMGGPPYSADSMGQPLAALALEEELVQDSATTQRTVSVPRLFLLNAEVLAPPLKQKNVLVALISALWGPGD